MAGQRVVLAALRNADLESGIKPNRVSRKMPSSPLLKRLSLAAAFVVTTMGVTLSYVLEQIGVPPRALGPYLERRASGHHPVIVRTGEWMSHTLVSLDRGEQLPLMAHRFAIGAQANAAPVARDVNGSGILVSSTDEAIKAIATARPGDVITFLPGVYRFRGRSVDVRQTGTDRQRITVRAAHLDSVFIESDATEGFIVAAPYWTFENLNIRGVCSDHSTCEHAFHVAGKGSYFIARNNRITDFNAHFKINGSDEGFPDNGIIERNTLSNSTVRQTGNPVAPIDLVAASNWSIRGNVISDFVKAHGNQISHGAFAKGGGTNNRFEQNVVLCEYQLRGAPGQRVGLSLGNGGTGKQHCRDKRCITEQDGGVIEANLIAFCSDDGIYLNRSATSKILHNTLIDTGGISVRFAESSADIEGNLVDGAIRSRDGGLIRALDNYGTAMALLYLGQHPVRGLYENTDALQMKWKDEPPRRAMPDAMSLDLCGEPRRPRPTIGASESLSACLGP
jgi:hypothetical protein